MIWKRKIFKIKPGSYLVYGIISAELKAITTKAMCEGLSKAKA